MPLKYGDAVVLHDGVSMKNWKGGETRQYSFQDEGQEFTHPDHGFSHVYKVRRLDKGDPDKDWSMYIKPGSALGIAAIKMLTKEKQTLSYRNFEISKTTGAEQKDTRYDFKEIYLE